MKLDFDDLLIVPGAQSSIDSRSAVDIMYSDYGKKHLPIIAAPMDTVVSEENVNILESNSINCCIPRGCDYKPSESILSNNMVFKSYSLDEFISRFLSDKVKQFGILDLNNYILIDMANGHMEKLTNTVIKFKETYPHWPKLMVGNVANPETYKILSEAGADYIRIGIGNGNGCLTTQQLGIGYPMASLIKECYEIKKTINTLKQAKIVADGGMKNYSDIIKALALGADYVMVGSILNKSLDSAGPTYFLGIEIDQYSDYAKWLYKHKFKLKKKFRGMSTKEVQSILNSGKLKTSEGVIRYRPVEYTIEGWTNNFKDYLKSAMSYTDKKQLKDFIGNVELIHISGNSLLRYNK